MDKEPYFDNTEALDAMFWLVEHGYKQVRILYEDRTKQLWLACKRYKVENGESVDLDPPKMGIDAVAAWWIPDSRIPHMLTEVDVDEDYWWIFD